MMPKIIYLILMIFTIIMPVLKANALEGKSINTSSFLCSPLSSVNLKNNPGIFYFKEALCKIELIKNANDFNHVIKLLKKSSDNKYPASNFVLGLLFEEKYKHGSLYYGTHGQPSDIVEAIKYYKLASLAGSTTAENNIGIIYLNEENLSDQYKTKIVDVEPKNNTYITLPNMQQAILWLNIAAKHGNPASQGTLADLYKKGIGVTQNYTLAYAWSNLSISSQYKFNRNIGDRILELMINAEKKSRDDSYSKLTDIQKNTADKLLEEYNAKFVLEPNDYEKLCSTLQTVLLTQNSIRLLNSIKDMH